MPAHRILPDSGTLAQLHRRGMTYAQIADEYGVTQHAVYLVMRDAGLTKANARHADLIPWRVKKEHAHAYPAMMLRLLGQRRLDPNKPNDPAKARMLDRWLADVRERNVVVTYDASIPPNSASPRVGGWAYVTRQPGDLEFIRPPEPAPAKPDRSVREGDDAA